MDDLVSFVDDWLSMAIQRKMQKMQMNLQEDSGFDMGGVL
jgi:hypothetical protein